MDKDRLVTLEACRIALHRLRWGFQFGIERVRIKCEASVAPCRSNENVQSAKQGMRPKRFPNGVHKSNRNWFCFAQRIRVVQKVNRKLNISQASLQRLSELTRRQSVHRSCLLLSPRLDPCWTERHTNGS